MQGRSFNSFASSMMKRWSSLLARTRLRVVPIFPQGQQSEQNTSAHENHPTREKVTGRGERKMRLCLQSLIFLSPCHVSPFLPWGDFHACSRFARSQLSLCFDLNIRFWARKVTKTFKKLSSGWKDNIFAHDITWVVNEEILEVEKITNVIILS